MHTFYNYESLWDSEMANMNERQIDEVPKFEIIDEDEFNAELMNLKDITCDLLHNNLITLEEATKRGAKINDMNILIEEAKDKGVKIKYYKFSDGRMGYRFEKRRKMGFIGG